MPETELFPIYSPPLVLLLLGALKQKGSPLTEADVLAIRDSAKPEMVDADRAAYLEATRGFKDFSAQTIWAEWEAARKKMEEEGE